MYLLFEPVAFLEKLAALTPRPEINLVLYHGALAPHARGRAAPLLDVGPAHAPSVRPPDQLQLTPRR